MKNFESPDYEDAFVEINKTIRRNVQTFGLRVICLLCRRHFRHRPETDGRLRDRDCPLCAVKALRSWAWVRSHQKDAITLVREHRAGVRCFRA